VTYSYYPAQHPAEDKEPGDGEQELGVPKPLEWNIGTMMRMMRLDPKQLGWNDETEEWDNA